MSNLVTITTKFYDKSERYIINLEVQSRYKNSSKANMQKTNDQGVFVFQASANRTIEILARPPKQKDFTVFKTINSSAFSSLTHPVSVQLPKTIDEYRQVSQSTPAKGIVSTVFKIVDSNGKVMKNFPVQSRPKGKRNSPDKYTNNDGIVEVLSSPNRDIEVLVLTSNDEFQLKFSDNSGNGTEQPITIKLDESYERFKSITTIKILDRDGRDYIVEKTNVEVLNLNTKEKNIHSTSDGKIRITGIVGQSYQLTVYKPDGKPLKPQSYMATRIKNKPVELHLDVDITKGSTKQDDPEISKVIQENITCKTCGKSLQIDINFIKSITSKAKFDFQNALLKLPNFMKKYDVNTCRDLINILAQAEAETQDFTKLKEVLNYTKKTFKKPENIYSISPTTINLGFVRRGMSKYSHQQKLEYIWNNLTDNDAAYGFHLYGNEKYPNRDYRGRGLLHLTHFSEYEECSKATGLDIVNSPDLLEKNYYAAIETGVWFWRNKKNGSIPILTAKETVKVDSDAITTSITRLVNGGIMKLDQRKLSKKLIAKKFISQYGECK
ncbi:MULTISPECIES: glycoside hydrolase family 19 protein [unclassified Acinetobacter]|uniref:glycoside hydrolase family 19 protein n=1 Tax=unclassified Acinetobacter TaxID=196816 RepID=UPI00190DDA7F|nr:MULTISPECIES: glycoside hydrolase family 19 protein [unclassified Acinetobacter]MBK0064231.1 glycoside hydrolase family 19 [Acinetobacter sp. S55]MBK0067577.1 glycoside hydrolase family 19 [Acinetobacter sp. S54]